MKFDEVIKSRKSVRTFKSTKASWKDVLEAVDTAIQAPFAGNLNHLKFLIVEDKKIIEKISEFSHQVWINEAGIVVLALSDDTHLENLYGHRGRIYSRQQAGAAIENFLLKITDLGLASCWVGAYSDELIKQLLEIPAHVQIEAILPVGYEKGKNPKTPKRSLESALFWEKWNKRRRPELFQDPQIDNR
ncbi:nitroreductase family protein, partial [Candidatus Pacearchaeota archaeon]|nr:nitroreductase family protein [Candidatus Pacearchaeota archaeon]